MAKSCKSKSHWNDGTSAIIDQSGIPRPLWVTRRPVTDNDHSLALRQMWGDASGSRGAARLWDFPIG